MPLRSDGETRLLFFSVAVIAVLNVSAAIISNRPILYECCVVELALLEAQTKFLKVS